ncbi:MAG: hypothetical protein AAGJ40_09560 [Planctomycetota bacterium]
MDEPATIEIVPVENGGFDVRTDGKSTGHLTHSEVLGVVSALTLPEKRRELGWLKPIESAEPESTAEELRWFHHASSGNIRCYPSMAWLIKSCRAIDKTAIKLEDAIVNHALSEITTGEALCILARSGWTEGWEKARELAGMTPNDAYVAGQEACGIKPGDTVKVERAAEGYEMGWDNNWTSGMDRLAGREYVVGGPFAKNPSRGVYLEREVCLFPYFVLSKVDSPSEPAGDPKTRPTVTDPGEGYRLIDKKTEKSYPTDEWFDIRYPERGWKARHGSSGPGWFYREHGAYRRKIGVDTVDPGEGYRLIDKDADTPQEGDEYLHYSQAKWCVREHSGSWMSNYYRRKLPARAKVGDWVRKIGEPLGPYRVSNVVENGIDASALDEDGFITGFGFCKHGDYEIVRKVIKPWTMAEACKALADSSELFFGDAPQIVDGITKEGFLIENKTPHLAGAWPGHCESTPMLVSYSELAEQRSEIDTWNLGGSPCGTVIWEAAE